MSCREGNSQSVVASDVVMQANFDDVSLPDDYSVVCAPETINSKFEDLEAAVDETMLRREVIVDNFGLKSIAQTGVLDSFIHENLSSMIEVRREISSKSESQPTFEELQ
jgi:hypothetical protein